MAWPERSVRYHKRQTDCAIRDGYARFAADSTDVMLFDELLHYVRKRAARMLDARVLNGYHPGINALVNLCRFRSLHIRRMAGQYIILAGGSFVACTSPFLRVQGSGISRVILVFD